MKLKPALVVTVLFFAIALSGADEKGKKRQTRDYRIEKAGGTPYLVQNGMPFFGRFDSNHAKISLDGDWDFVFDPAGRADTPPREGWETLAVPGVWNYLRSETLNYIGVAWYRHIFRVDGRFAGKTVRLAFGGVNMRCRVWLNGEFIGAHEGGYTPFDLDATRAMVINGDNELLVRVDNSMTFTSLPPLNYEGARMGWFEYGGIHRSVHIEALPDVAVFKLAVDTTPDRNDDWRVGADVLVWDRRENPSVENITFEGVVSDPDGSEIMSLNVSEPMGEVASGVWGVSLDGLTTAPKIWSPETPQNRYRLTVKVMEDGREIDSASTEFGFRQFVANRNGLYLNGRPYYIRGINRHEDDPVTGLVDTAEVIDRDLDLIEQLNVNHMRPAHYPNDPKLLDRTDVRGIGITEEIPLYQAGVGFAKWFQDRVQRGQKIGRMHFGRVKPSQFRNSDLVKNATLALIEMIERDRNHPSVLAWSMGNENWTFSKKNCSTYKTLREVAKLFDPQKPVTYAMLLEVGPLHDKCGDLADFISVNEYFGWYVGESEDVEDFLNDLHKRYPDKPIVVSEFGAGAVMDPSKVRSGRQDGQGTFNPKDQAELIARHWEIFRRLPYVWGGMPWIFADFRNAWFKEEHPLPFFNTKGVMTHDREPKPAFETLREIYLDLEKNPPPRARP